MKVYDISHWATRGIVEREGEEEMAGRFRVKPKRAGGCSFMLKCGDWVHDRQRALEEAQDRRLRAVRACERRLAKLKAIKF
jgi:hypothetical protein